MEKKEFFEAELLSSECLECDTYRDEDNQGEYDEVAPCENCGNEELIHDTSFEGITCETCDHMFEPWEGAYVGTSTGNLYCKECEEK